MILASMLVTSVGGGDLSGVVWHSRSSSSSSRDCSRACCDEDPRVAASTRCADGFLLEDGPELSPAAESNCSGTSSTSSDTGPVGWHAVASQRYRGLVSCMAFDATGELLVAGLRDGSICAWNSSISSY
jgi:hypothetical protein